MEEKKKLVFGNEEFVGELWPGNNLNPPCVELEIDAFHTHYDRDYGTETPITGRYDLSMDEAKKLHAFLGDVTGAVEYEYNLRVDGEPYYHKWANERLMADLWDVETLEEVKDKLPAGWSMIKRIAPGKVEDV
jgi:hypothetical protein